MPRRDTGEAARHLHRALTLQQRGERGAAGAAARAALEAFSQAGDPTGTAAAHHLLFVLDTERGALEEAEAHLSAALALREASGDREGLASLHQQRFALAVQRGDAAAAREASEAVLAAYEAIGDRENQAAAIHQLAQFLIHAGELERARELLERGMWLTDRAGEERGRAAILGLLSQVDMAAGNTARALARSREAVSVAGRGGKRQAAIEARANLGTLLAATGELEPARRVLEEVLDGRELMRDLPGRADTLRELAGVEQALGLTGEALGRLDYAARTWAELGEPGGQATALHAATALADEAGRLEDALRYGERLAAVCEAMGDEEAAGAAQFTLGTLWTQRGDLSAAAERFRAAAAHQAAAGAAEARGVSLGMLGQVLHALERPEEAEAVLAEAEATLEAIGSDHLGELRAIRDALRQPS